MDQEFPLDKLKVPSSSVVPHDDEEQQQQQQQLVSTSDYTYIHPDLLDRQTTHYPYITVKKHELLKQSTSPPVSSQLRRTDYLKSNILKDSSYLQQHLDQEQQAVIHNEHPGSIESPQQISDTEMASVSMAISPSSVSVESNPVSICHTLPMISRKDGLDHFAPQLVQQHYQAVPSVSHYPDFDRIKYEVEEQLNRNAIIANTDCQSLENINPVSEYSSQTVESQEDASRRLYALARMVDLKMSQSYLHFGTSTQYVPNLSGQFVRAESESYDGYTEMQAKNLPDETMKDMDEGLSSKQKGETAVENVAANTVLESKDHRRENDTDTHESNHVQTEVNVDKKELQCVTNTNGAETFVCGGCSVKFDSMCHLHMHLKEHGSGGSYHYDHVSHTAFPKFDTFCSFTQTDAIDFDIDREPEIEPAEFTDVEEKAVESQPTGPSKRPSRKCVAENKDSSTVTAEGLSERQTGRKRKQAHPKPSKPLMYIVPLDKLRKRTSAETARRRVNARRKAKTEAKPIEEPDFSENDNDVEKAMETDIENDLSDSIEDGTSDKSQDTLQTEAKDQASLAKPFKKRGRPRKCGGQIQNGVTERKIKVKKLQASGGRRGRRPKHTPSFTDTAEKDFSNSLTDGFSEEEPMLDNDEDTSKETAEESKDKQTSKKKKYQLCKMCGLTIPQHNYVFHMRQHTGERPFVCEKCGKAFARSRFLTKHLVTHEEVKPWRCPMCPSQFCQKNEYKMHMAGHAGDRPFQCKVCEMRFLSKTSLHTHQANIHMGLTRFECEVCKRRFFKRSSLTVHVATHFEATMKCNFCDRKFRDKTGLKRHERIHTGVKKFKCHICEHAFIQSTPFWAHMEKRHNMDKKKVKELLHEIREENRRSGIKTEINVLPNDVEMKPLTLPTIADVSKVCQSSNMATTLSLHTAGSVQMVLNQSPKTYTDIKVPIIQSLPEGETRINDVYQVFDSELMARNFSQHTSLQGQSSTSAEVLLAPDATSAINLCNATLTTPTSQYSLLHQALQTPVNSTGAPLSHHGFIGLNQLQQAVDFVGSIPQSMAYTDISDRALDQQ